MYKEGLKSFQKNGWGDVKFSFVIYVDFIGFLLCNGIRKSKIKVGCFYGFKEKI